LSTKLKKTEEEISDYQTKLEKAASQNRQLSEYSKEANSTIKDLENEITILEEEHLKKTKYTKHLYKKLAEVKKQLRDKDKNFNRAVQEETAELKREIKSKEEWILEIAAELEKEQKDNKKLSEDLKYLSTKKKENYKLTQELKAKLAQLTTRIFALDRQLTVNQGETEYYFNYS
jgi:chromosome segregation ATPase